MEFEQLEGELIITSTPDVISVKNSRKSERINLPNSLRTQTAVLIQSQGLHYEASFQLEDLSQNGLGGCLSSAHELPLAPDSTIVGSISTSKGSFALSDTIARAERIYAPKAGRIEYRIGIDRSTTQHSVREPSENRRTQDRFAASEQLELCPVVKPALQFTIALTEASISGFSGKVNDPTADLSFPIGMNFSLTGSSLACSLSSFSESILRFRWVAGSEKDRVSWLKRISRYIEPGATVSINKSASILELFCQSGAVSSEYLRTHSPLAHSILEGLATDSREQFWVHRWVSTGTAGRPVGHISAIKISDNTWLIGDIVGSQKPGERMPKTFVPQFMKSFRDFSLTLEPCPRHLIMWVEKHPYWKRLEEYLDGSGRNTIVADARMGYTRLTDMHGAQERLPVNAKKIGASDHHLVMEISSLLRKSNLLSLASTLDFDIDRFGSPNLRRAFSESGQPFTRSFFYLEVGKLKYLAVLSGFPLGLSLNRVTDSCWLFPLGDFEINDDEWATLKVWLQKEALTLGIKAPNIRRIFTSPPVHNAAPLPGETTILRCLVCHPDIWKVYEAAA
ncbi:MAG: hypothetical protein HY074_13100 [Deltaproteobacteria bacterium]|nr:hypothetical protein [Deltaproteobacteria bacterium]